MSAKFEPSEKTDDNAKRYNDYKTEMMNHTDRFRSGSLSADDYGEKMKQAKLKFWRNRGKPFAFDPPKRS